MMYQIDMEIQVYKCKQKYMIVGTKNRHAILWINLHISKKDSNKPRPYGSANHKN